MTITKDDYLLLLKIGKIQSVFRAALREIFTDPSSREETVLHTFFVEKITDNSTDSEKIYYNASPLSENEILERKGDNYISFFKKYLTEKTGYSGHIVKESDVVLKDGMMCRMYWALSSECLDSYHGTMVLNRFFQQFVDRAYLLTDQFKAKDDRDEIDDSIQASEIIHRTESDIALYLQVLFKPFVIGMVDDLSGEYYEKSECRSNLVFLPQGVVEDIDPKDWVCRVDKFPLISSQNRLIRKLLQISQDKSYLVLSADGQGQVFWIYGICKQDVLTQFNAASIPYLNAKIRKHMLWNLFLNDKYILSSRNGKYVIEREIQGNYLRNKLTKFFGERSKEYYNKLVSNIFQLIRQEHGTILIIMEQEYAEREAERLGESDYGFRELRPEDHNDNDDNNNNDYIKQLGAIDGSVLIDTEGRIHGIGMILDGISRRKGKRERGSRYNSVVKYLESLDSHYPYPAKVKGMGIVVSEDGFVDIVS